jgi:hypothetical protein
MSVQDMRAELKLLRQEHPDHQPVSKMKKADISSLLEKMKQKTEITPATAMMKAEPMTEGQRKEKGDATAPKEKPMKAEPKIPSKGKASKGKAEPEKKADAPKKKESISERMARIREMRKKD